jgi:hypothetical protein
MSEKINFRDPVLIIGLLLILYFLQGLLYPSGGILSRTILMVILLYGVYSLVMCALLRHNPTFVILFMSFLILLGITYVLSPKYVYGTKFEAIGKVSTMQQFKNACAFVLSFFIGYYASVKKGCNIKNLNLIGLLFMLASIIIFFYSRNKLTLELQKENVVNNVAYNFVAVVPFVPLFFLAFKRNFWGLTSIAVIIVMVMFGAKRGALVCTILSLAFALVYYLNSNKFSIRRIIVVIVAAVVAYLLIDYMYESSDFLQGRVTKTFEKGIGMRSIGYSVLFNSWLHDTNTLQFLFGRGSAATISVWGNYGHQDWLELLTDNGLLGAVLYAAIFISAFSYVRKSRANTSLKLSMYLCILTWFLKSMFSMGYTSIESSFSMLLFGSLIGLNKTEANNMRNTHSFQD